MPPGDTGSIKRRRTNAQTNAIQVSSSKLVPISHNASPSICCSDRNRHQQYLRPDAAGDGHWHDGESDVQHDEYQNKAGRGRGTGFIVLEIMGWLVSW